MPGFSADAAGDLRDLARDLKAAGEDGKLLRKNLRKRVVAAVKPMKDDARNRILAIPSKGKSKNHLRQNMARALRVKVTISQANSRVRLEVDPRKMPAGQERLPGLMEGEARAPWRHPVFGDTKTWVTQPHHPAFYPAVQANLPKVQTEIQAALNDTAAALERGNPT